LVPNNVNKTAAKSKNIPDTNDIHCRRSDITDLLGIIINSTVGDINIHDAEAPNVKNTIKNNPFI
jgi:hypothetical protein